MERDEAAIARCKHEAWPCVKNAPWMGVQLVFVNDAGFRLPPTVRKTWCSVSQPPLVRYRNAPDRISALSRIAVSPQRDHRPLYGHLYVDSIHDEEVAVFLRHLRRQNPGHRIGLLDNGGILRGKPIEAVLAPIARLHLEPLSPEAPKLHPDDGVGNPLKVCAANGRRDSQAELMDRLADDVCRLPTSQSLLRGYIERAALPLFFL
ncbi:MAG TPA: hypothetical protein PKY01_17045 [Candidatus Hydrogenedentes bacterium]|nr:hypothetical protein [Candidatus Hydrogenedentota bacterium]